MHPAVEKVACCFGDFFARFWLCFSSSQIHFKGIKTYKKNQDSLVLLSPSCSKMWKGWWKMNTFHMERGRRKNFYSAKKCQNNKINTATGHKCQRILYLLILHAHIPAGGGYGKLNLFFDQFEPLLRWAPPSDLLIRVCSCSVFSKK